MVTNPLSDHGRSKGVNRRPRGFKAPSARNIGRYWSHVKLAEAEHHRRRRAHVSPPDGKHITAATASPLWHGLPTVPQRFSLQKRHEARLLEMPIGGQGLSDAFALHDDE